MTGIGPNTERGIGHEVGLGHELGLGPRRGSDCIEPETRRGHGWEGPLHNFSTARLWYGRGTAVDFYGVFSFLSNVPNGNK